ncbi:MAG: hypothetical protein PHI88_00560 [Candidatus Pacebacteria bacterium]|nr:hypothetical protein [Candidatus Paceibacterota bacterium]
MIDKEGLLDETYNTLKPVQELKNGILVYNKPHFKSNFIDITTDRDKLADKLSKGWSFYPGKYRYILRAPEVVLCDLSENYINPTLNLAEIFTLHKLFTSEKVHYSFKKDISSRFKNLEIVYLEGPHSNLEIRIAGSDNRINQIPKFIYYKIKKTNHWKKELKKIKAIIKEREIKIKNKEIKRCCFKTKDFYSRLKKEYSIFGKINFPRFAIFGFFKTLPKSDIYIFIPKAGLKYALGFIEEIGIKKKIMLWECHLSLDMTKEMELFRKDLRNKKISIIDRSYSSNTLDYLERKVKKRGGKPIKIALFPKSKRAIKHSNYILFLDKIIPSKNIIFRKNWEEELFIKVINNETKFL